MRRKKKAVITGPFPKVGEAAKILGVSRLRTEYLRGLVDGIRVSGKTKKKNIV